MDDSRPKKPKRQTPSPKTLATVAGLRKLLEQHAKWTSVHYGERKHPGGKLPRNPGAARLARRSSMMRCHSGTLPRFVDPF